MPTDIVSIDAPELSISHAFSGGCGCPVCSGLAVVVDGPDLREAISYQNADQRSGVSPNGKENLTIDQAGMKLIGYEPGWSAALGVGFTVSYGFRATAPATMPKDAADFSPFNTAQVRQTELALTSWADVANIRFVRAAPGDYTNDATMLFANYSSGIKGASAFAYYPGDTRFFASSGDVWVNITSGSNANPLTGNFAGQVLVHEIGHAIGLAHPSDYDVTATSEPITYAGNASYFADSRQYTVMSYFGEWNTGGEYGQVNSQGRYIPSYAAAPQLDDIAAAQFEYGVNFQTRAGDTVYGFNSNAERPWFEAISASSRLIFAVWDAGGTDTFDFSGFSQKQVIDLREGFFSDVGGLVGNVAVAKGAVIENVKSGSGADVITGNDAANAISGGAGGDTIIAGAGFDTVHGGPGDDLIGGGAGASFLRGEEGDDVLIGGSSFDDLHGNMGNDTLMAGDDADWVVGGQGNDVLHGGGGNDILYGNLGDDYGEGGEGADLLRGGQGNDIMRGDGGDDLLFGDRGDDILFGGAGADTFTSFAAAGLDIVADFNQAEGDRVRLEAGTAYTTYQDAAGTIVDMGGGNLVILQNIQLASLQAGWLFVG